MLGALESFPGLLVPSLLIAAAALLIVPAAVTAESRQQALVTMLSALLLTVVLMALANIQDSPFFTLYVHTALPLLAAALIAMPLIDRARTLGLAMGAAAGGVIINLGFFQQLLNMLPEIACWVHATVIAAVTVGLGGSMLLPMHAARFTQGGAVRLRPTAQGTLLLGWVALAFALAMLSIEFTLGKTAPWPLLISACVAALFTLVRAPGVFDTRLQKAGEALAAGVLITGVAPLEPLHAAIAGVAAGYFVSRSEAMTHNLRIDDAYHLTGALLLPAMCGLLLPGLLDLAQLADHVRWLGASLGLGIAVAIAVWFGVIISVGLRVRA